MAAATSPARLPPLPARRRRPAAALGVAAAVLGLHAWLMTTLAPALPQRLGGAADEAAPSLVLRTPLRARTVVVMPTDQNAELATHPAASLPASVATELSASPAGNAAGNAAAIAAAPRSVPTAVTPRVATPTGSSERPLAAAPSLADAAPAAAAPAAAPADAAPAAAGLAVPAAAWPALIDDELKRHEPRLVSGQPSQPSQPDGTDAAPPVYATRIPPPVHLLYALRYNGQAGEATLSWRHDGLRYQLALEGLATSQALERLGTSQALVVQTSQGGFDSAGLAPERFTDRRRGGQLQAANFRRDIGRIGFSGPAVDYPAWPGAQDRLSWLPQFVAIRSAAASAAAGLVAPGAADAGRSTTSLFVVDARGGGALWHFQSEGEALLATVLGPVAAQRWRREPPRPEGLRVEAWLDAARGHWPLLLRFTALRSGDVFELRLLNEPTLPP